MQNKQNFISELQKYIDGVGKYFQESKFDIYDLRIDHICYKCSTKEEYENIRGWFEFGQDLIYQAIISKRRIATVVFADKLQSVFGTVSTLELSDQKPDNSQISGIDHIEMVWPGGDYDEFRKRIEGLGFKLEVDAKPHHTTYNFKLPDGKEIKLSAVSLVDKVAEEMRVLKNK